MRSTPSLAALALLRLAPGLRHATNNVGSGRATSNAEVIAAIASVEPGFHGELPPRDVAAPRWLDTTRLREDTGFGSEYDTAAAAADYITYVRGGSEQ
ncbi:hypothetical protein ABT317_14150 [Streptomyces carpinensis]|uniref:Uncharacterized protein n=1 Tax=Streptomyces carpinensis TaxID=66369 RepID=A0ABV1W1Q9_9ACTN